MTPNKQQIVGKSYLIPMIFHKRAFWPIVGPWHEDADIGFSKHHFHFDIRFLTDTQYKILSRRSVSPLGRVQTNPDGEMEIQVLLKRRKMRREWEEFPAYHWGSPVEFVAELENRFADQTMKCMTCPHRGMPLDSLPVKDGAVVCNGHGLKWDVKTGRMIRRIPTKANP